jgi:signal transduction histidine kinase
VKSLSGRLSWGLALSLIALLVVQWAIASYTIRYMIEDQVASRLIQDSETLLAGIRFDEAGHFSLDAKRINTIYDRPFSGHYYVIAVDGQEHVSRSLWDAELLVPEVNAGVDVRLTIDGPDNQSLLSITHGYLKQDKLIGITVAEDLQLFNTGLRQFQWIYGSVSAAFLVMLLLVQYLIVRHELRPLKTLRSNMAKLERGETDRIEALGPAEIAPVISELNRLLSTMGKKARRSRESLGNLAHALRTRLSILSQVAYQPEIIALPDTQRAILETTEAMRRSVERELKRARLVGDALPGQRVNLQEEIACLVKTLESIHADKSPNIRWQVAADARFVGDQEDLLELLGNLLDNACKWCKREVQLDVLSRDGVVFTIEDDGSGCPEDEVELLTKRGFRADETKPGSGLGLAIVRDIVESYGGELAISRSSELGGLSVEVRIPQYQKSQL